MKKFVLRDEYEAISRDELKAFADEINNQGEAKRAKGADAEKARKVGKGFARSKVGKYLDNGKYEGIIYERKEKLSLFKNDKDIEIVVPEFVRDYVLVVDYVGICHQNLMAMAKARIMPVMVGARWKLWDVNNNDDFIGQSSRNYNNEMINGIVERGINWSKLMYDGVDASRAFAKSWVNDERNIIKVIGIGEREVKSMFYSIYKKGVYCGKDAKSVNRVSRNKQNELGLNGKIINSKIGNGKNHKIYKKLYIYNERENEKKKVEDDKEEIGGYVRSEIEGGMVEVMSKVEKVEEVNKFRYDRNDIVKEDMKGIMKKSDDEKVSANVEHSIKEIKAYNNNYINDEGEIILRGHEIFSINKVHEARSGNEKARVRMKERNNNLNKNIGGKYWSAILNKWISY